MTVPARSSSLADREFSLEDRHFRLLQRLARQQVGIELNESKREMIYSRLVRRLRALGIGGFDDYCDLLQVTDSAELGNFVNAITTNVTSFFREPHHFDFLADQAIPTLLTNRATPRLRLWSAACSTGQEPYSIAATLATTIGTERQVDWKVLATDVDTDAVTTAAIGRYPASELPDRAVLGERAGWFRTGAGGQVEVDQVVRERVRFATLNLMGHWPMKGPIDVIFCRNVTIYFSVETQRQLFMRFAQLLAPDGYIMIGHSESLLHSPDLFTAVGRTIYQRVGTAG